MTKQTGEEHLRYWTTRRQYAPESFVYVIRAVGDSPIKVGVAVDVQARLSGLQTGNPRQLQLLYVLVGGVDLERELHRELDSARLFGEWFDGSEVEPFLDFVADLAERMLVAYRANKQILNYKRFSPFSERIEAARKAQLPGITAEQLERRGRLSGAPLREDPARDSRVFRAAQEEPTFSPHRP